MSSPETLRGGCACGAASYEVPDAFRYAIACHCSRCRRATGSAFKPMGGIEVGEVRHTGGELMTVGDPSGTHDRRCAACGSLLWSVVRDGAWAHVAYGSLIDPPSLAIQAHIMVGSKAPWDTICDGLPQHDEF